MATPPGKVPIVESARAGFDFFRAHWRQTAPAAALAAVVATAAQVATSEPAGLGLPAQLLVNLAAAVVGVLYSALLYRLALRGDASGWFGLKFGADELRLLGASAVIGFFFFIILVVGGLAVGFALVAAGRDAGVDWSTLESDPEAAAAALEKMFSGGAGLAWLMVFAAAFFGLLWLSARLSLALPATIGERRVLTFETWAWTRANGLRIVAALLLLAAPMVFGLALATGVIEAVLGVVTGDPAAVRAPVAGRLWLYAVSLLVTDLAQYAIILPAVAGLQAHLYMGLRPPDRRAPNAS
jgi:hypothetical protein